MCIPNSTEIFLKNENILFSISWNLTSLNQTPTFLVIDWVFLIACE